MKFGIAHFFTDYGIAPDEFGRLAEDRGFESLFAPEHTHIPASRETPYPAGEPLPKEYWHTLDPFVALTAAAAATKELNVATGICLIIERDPIITAKQVATLDLVSGGRFLFGIGAGWNEEEMRNHGTDPARRFGLMRERVEAMKAIWTEDDSEYHGERVDFDPIWSWPKPVQKPHPPIIVGGNGKKAPDRVRAYGDEWMPNRLGDDEKIQARIRKLDKPVTLSVAPLDAATIEAYEEAGVHRCVWYVPAGAPEEAEPVLDKLAAAMDAAQG